MGSVHVVGSVNLDLVVAVDRLPRQGETVPATRVARHPGGKGANQALAASRMGAEVTFTAAVGDDPEVEFALALLEADPMVVLDLAVVAGPTGLAVVMVDHAGENLIAVVPGANASLSVDHLPTTIQADATVVQGEVPVSVSRAAFARSQGWCIANPAPVTDASGDLVAMADVVVVNESERADLAAVLSGFGGWLVTTLGSAGATVERQGRLAAEAQPPVVAVVDTVGAGDAFCGALAAGLAEGRPIAEVLPLAVTAGALATEVPGAQPSLPHRAAVEARCPSPS